MTEKGLTEEVVYLYALRASGGVVVPQWNPEDENRFGLKFTGVMYGIGSTAQGWEVLTWNSTCLASEYASLLAETRRQTDTAVVWLGDDCSDIWEGSPDNLFTVGRDEASLLAVASTTGELVIALPGSRLTNQELLCAYPSARAAIDYGLRSQDNPYSKWSSEHIHQLPLAGGRYDPGQSTGPAALAETKQVISTNVWEGKRIIATSDERSDGVLGVWCRADRALGRSGERVLGHLQLWDDGSYSAERFGPTGDTQRWDISEQDLSREKMTREWIRWVDDLSY